VRAFYANSFIPQVPPDLQVTTISQTVSAERIVEEAVATFTHSLPMEWMLPGVAPSGKRLELAFVTIIQFRGDLIAHEHLYWDQASMLVQLGLLDAGGLPIAGADTARLVRDPTAFAALLPRGHQR
jgi:carboxymethylenebutenolidase